MGKKRKSPWPFQKVLGSKRQFILLFGAHECFLPVLGHIRQPYSPNSWLFPFYHHQQSRGITCLLDMKRSLFALSQARRKGHHVISQLFDWFYLPHSLLITIAFSKRYCILWNLHGIAASLHFPGDTGATRDRSGLRAHGGGWARGAAAHCVACARELIGVMCPRGTQ